MAADLRSRIPSVEHVLQTDRAREWMDLYSRSFVLDTIRDVVGDIRRSPEALSQMVGDTADDARPVESAVLDLVAARLDGARAPRLRPVVNATGVVLHTNLGRAVLGPRVISDVTAAARSAVTLEYDLARGVRGDRDAVVEADLIALTGAEAATVVNNNAAAVLLVLSALAHGRECVVSRGELIEIGGSFRIPEIMAKSGARLREVGTTNRTHPADYQAAIGPGTGLLLKVHTSNYRIVGFTAAVGLDELVRLGHEHGIPVVEDLGSGALIDLTAYGLPGEPVVADRIAAGADVVTFSGDKLLGGPQAGIIVGRRDLLERIRRDPLRRAVRPGKLDLAALEATLRLYRQSTDLRGALPTLRWLTRPIEEMQTVARAAIPILAQRLGTDFEIGLVDSESEVGSGALPGTRLPTCALAVSHPERSPDEIAAHFRRADPPVIGRVSGGLFLLDLRGIFAAEELAVTFAAPAPGS